jgi:hypothetical protein
MQCSPVIIEPANGKTDAAKHIVNPSSPMDSSYVEKRKEMGSVFPVNYGSFKHVSKNLPSAKWGELLKTRRKSGAHIRRLGPCMY